MHVEARSCRQWTAGIEAAALRQVSETRNGPVDRVELLGLGHRVGRNRLQEPLGVGMLGILENFEDVTVLDGFPCVHDHYVISHLRDDAEVVRDEEDRRFLFPLQLFHETQDLRLNRYIESRRRLIGDQKARLTGQSHRDHDPLPHTARELERVLVEALVGVGDMHELHHAQSFLHRFAARHAPVDAKDFGYLLADGINRVQSRHRLLKNHGDAVAADGAHFLFGKGPDVLSFEDDLAVFDKAIGVLNEAHDGHGGDRLAATRLTDDGESLALFDSKTDPIEGTHASGLGVESRP